MLPTRWGSDGNRSALLGEGVAVFHIARTESLLKPVHTLLRTAVGKGFRIHCASRHRCKPVISDGGGCIQAFAHLAGIEQFSLVGRVSPHARKAVGLQLESFTKAG